MNSGSNVESFEQHLLTNHGWLQVASVRLLWLPGSWCWRRKVSLWVASRGLRLPYLYPPMPRRPSSVCPSDHHWPSSTLSGCFLEPLFADLKLVWNIIVSNLDSIWICCAFRTSAPAIFYNFTFVGYISEFQQSGICRYIQAGTLKFLLRHLSVTISWLKRMGFAFQNWPTFSFSMLLIQHLFRRFIE